MRLHFCTFADSRMKACLDRIRQEAEEMRVFDAIHCLNENNLDRTFTARNRHLLKPEVRGFGYWIWKPQAVLQVLNVMADGDVLLYADAGCHLNKKGEKMLRYYIDYVLFTPPHLLVFSPQSPKEREYTKGDVLDYFQVRNNPAFTETGQIQATAFFIRKQENTCRLVQEWLHIMQEHNELIDDTPSRSPNLPDFKEHRHDQSIFSLLIKRQHALVLPMTQIWSRTWLFMNRYPIWAVRHKEGAFKRNITPKRLLYDLWNYLKRKR